MMETFLTDYLPWLWLAVLVISIIIEAATLALTTIWTGIAALPMIFLSMLPIPFRWQLLIFALLTLILVLFTRPFAVSKLHVGRKNDTNVHALEGQKVLVLKAVSDFEKGEAKAKNGVIWTVVSESGEAIPAQTIGIVKRVEGNSLVIAPLSADTNT